MNFLELNIKGMETIGFWTEQHKSVIIAMLEASYKPEIIKEWQIIDVVFNGDNALLKWKARLRPLTDQELKDKYAIG